MSDQSTTLLIKLLATGDLAAFTQAKEKSEALKLSVEGLKGALEMVGVGFSLGAIIEGTKAMVEYGATIKHLSEQANISTTAFQQLSYTALGAGVKQDELGTALNTLNRNMAQAADGASKQNRAITDLGLNTAELLAMPVEEQVQAIATAYVGASDKGKAWADVIALLGKNSAKFREILNEMGKDGEKPNSGIIISPDDLERLDKTEKTWAKIWANAKAIGAQSVARPRDAMNAMMGAFYTGGLSLLGSNPFSAKQFEAKGGELKKPGEDKTDAEKAAAVAEAQANLEATIAADPKIIALTEALARAKSTEAIAYKSASDAAKAYRMQADQDEARGQGLLANRGNKDAQEEGLKLLTEAANLRRKAHEEDNKADKEQKQFEEQMAALAERRAQLATARLAVDQQLFQAHVHEGNLTRELAGLDMASVDYKKDKVRLETELLKVQQEISALDEKGTAAFVEEQVREHEIQQRREAIALAAVEHDANLTDVQKWDEKRAILARIVTEQEAYITNMRTIAGSAGMPQGARDKAKNAADTGANSLAGTQEQIGAMGANPHDFMGNFRDGLTKLRSQWGTLQQEMAHGLTGTISSGLSSVSTNLTKLIMHAQSLGQAFRNIAVDIGTTLVQAFVDMGVKWIAQRILMATVDKSVGAASVAATVPMAMAQSAIWAAPATLATIASWGGAALAAPFEMMASIAASQAMALGGFAAGGFTGGMEGAAAGVVHGQEFVFSAPAVRNIGAGNLDRAHQAALGGGGGVSSPAGAPGAGGNIILAMSPEDVARSQRKYTDARVQRMAGRTPNARFKL